MSNPTDINTVFRCLTCGRFTSDRTYAEQHQECFEIEDANEVDSLRRMAAGL